MTIPPQMEIPTTLRLLLLLCCMAIAGVTFGEAGMGGAFVFVLSDWLIDVWLRIPPPRGPKPPPPPADGPKEKLA